MATAKSEKNSDSVKIVSTTEHDSNAIAARHGLTIHPAAKLFAMQNGDEIRALADDIKRNGQRVKIAVQKKVIIDGRNRLVACEIAGVTPQFEEIDGDPVEKVFSLNLLRRNLNESERATLALRLIAQLKNNAPEKKSSRPNDSGRSGKSSEQIGAMAGVSGRIVERLMRIERLQPHRISDIESSKVTVGEVYDAMTKDIKLVETYHADEYKKLDERGKKGEQVADDFAEMVKSAKETQEQNPQATKPREPVLIVMGSEDELRAIKEMSKGSALLWLDKEQPKKEDSKSFVAALKAYAL